MPDDSEDADRMVESLLLAATRVLTFEQQRPLTNASGFFFERAGRLFLVTSGHVLFDEPSKHSPDRTEIELHIEAANMARSIGFSIPLYRGASRNERQGEGCDGWRSDLEASSRAPAVIDLGARDHQIDEALGLNCAWYADLLLALTGPLPGVVATAPEGD